MKMRALRRRRVIDEAEVWRRYQETGSQMAVSRAMGIDHMRVAAIVRARKARAANMSEADYLAALKRPRHDHLQWRCDCGRVAMGDGCDCGQAAPWVEAA